MDTDFEKYYSHIRSGGSGFCEQKRGLIAVWGKEAVQFLDGLISNDMKTLEDGTQMLAAFPNAQGRLLAVVRVLRQGDRFLFETEKATREKVFNNLFRFTFAGDFFVEDVSEQYRYFELFGPKSSPPYDHPVGETPTPLLRQEGSWVAAFRGRGGSLLVPISADDAEVFRDRFLKDGAVEISDELHETLRIENGIPKYGVDMDETTIVPELGIDGLISYKKGCYIGQEIIARIHFRGHVANGYRPDPVRTWSGSDRPPTGSELKSIDGKNAGRIASTTFSPKSGRMIALAFVRFDYLAEGTELLVLESSVTVKSLPFFDLLT